MMVEIDGVKIVNATPHEIRFQAETGEIVTVQKCGKTIPARPVETPVKTRGNVILVKTVFKPSVTSEEELANLEYDYPGAIIVGSIISAQAFPGRVYSLVPVPGTERAAPADKVYLPTKFNVFGFGG